MYCRCNNEFDWLLEMLKKGDCFLDWKNVAEFIDDSLLKLRYMKKRFGYLFTMNINILRKLMVVMLFLLIKSTNLFVVNLINLHFMELMKTYQFLIQMEQQIIIIFLILLFL